MSACRRRCGSTIQIATLSAVNIPVLKATPPHTHCMFAFQVISSLAAPHLGILLSSAVPVALPFPGLTSRRAGSGLGIATRRKFAIVSYPGGSSLPGSTSKTSGV